MMCFTGYAQSDSVNLAFSRIELLESIVNSQAQQLNKLSSDLNEVLKQNLALKQNLHLKPTIAKFTTSNGLEYRLLQVLGDKSNYDVKMLISVDNPNGEDIEVRYRDANEFIDELGQGYNNSDRYIIKMPGIRETLKGTNVIHHPHTPVNIEITIKKYNPDAQYLKYMMLCVTSRIGESLGDTSFENIPIKWVETIDAQEQE